MKKEIIISFVAGAIIMATGYLGVVFFKSIKVLNQHDVVLQQIVSIINESTKAQNPAPAVVK